MNFWSEKIAFSVLSSTAANSFEGQKCVCEDTFDDSCACRQEEKIRIKRQGELSVITYHISIFDKQIIFYTKS